MTGFFVGILIISTWVLSLFHGLLLPAISWESLTLANLGLSLWLQILCAGLFITTHDAFHGSLVPRSPTLNLWMGRISALLYAGFIFDHIKEKHAEHHRSPGTRFDPDFKANGSRSGSYLSWMFSFFKNYLEFSQLLTMVLIAQILIHGLHFPVFNVVLFWVAPAVLSAIQLFTFGTYFPHRVLAAAPFVDHHRARNLEQNFFQSLISCYHFGGWHLRHHQNPKLPWYRLPF